MEKESRERPNILGVGYDSVSKARPKESKWLLTDLVVGRGGVVRAGLVR